MRTRIKLVLIGIVAGLLGCDNGGARTPAATCTECGSGSLACSGDTSACLAQECVVAGTSLGEAVTLNAGHYTLTSPSGTTSGTFTVVDGGIVLSHDGGPAAILGVYQDICPFN